LKFAGLSHCLLEIHSWCKRIHFEDLKITPPPRTLGMEVDGAIGAVSGTVAAVVALIRSGYQICQIRNRRMDRLQTQEEVSTECARMGLPVIHIHTIDNFAALLDEPMNPAS